MSINPREIAYQIDPVLWLAEELKVTLALWQEQFLREPEGTSIVVLTARQVGKTTTAAWAIAHRMLFWPGSLSVIACPAQRQNAEAVRCVRSVLMQVGAKLRSDNVYGVELENGSRVLALRGSDDFIRGLTVNGWIVADEAARLPEDLLAALRPMRARCPEPRLAMLSTAWSRTDPFWTVWTNGDDAWRRIQVTGEDAGYPSEYLAQERKAMGEQRFNQEYMGIPAGGAGNLFTWDLFEAATRKIKPVFAPAPASRDFEQERGVPVPNPFTALNTQGERDAARKFNAR